MIKTIPKTILDTAVDGVNLDFERLGDAWQDERVLLVFLRHFG